MPAADVLIALGDHEPVMLLVEVVGSDGAIVPLHKGEIELNIGFVNAVVDSVIVNE